MCKLDDILIGGVNWEKNIKNLAQVLITIIIKNLYCAVFMARESTVHYNNK